MSERVTIEQALARLGITHKYLTTLLAQNEIVGGKERRTHAWVWVDRRSLETWHAGGDPDEFIPIDDFVAQAGEPKQRIIERCYRGSYPASMIARRGKHIVGLSRDLLRCWWPGKYAAPSERLTVPDGHCPDCGCELEGGACWCRVPLAELPLCRSAGGGMPWHEGRLRI